MKLNKKSAGLLAAVLALSLVSAPCAGAAAPVTVQGSGSSTGSTGGFTGRGIKNIAEYERPELYVQYQNGVDEVLSFSGTDELKEAIFSLESNPDVAWFQPNYSYDRTGEIADDYFADQWALSNDGSFRIENEYEDFPFYTDPFDDPYTDWEDNFWDSFTDIEDFLRDIGFSNRASGSKYTWSGSSPNAVSGIDINMENAWAVYNGGVRDTIVAVIDTGIDYTHEDLADSLWVNENEIPGDGIDNDGNGYVDDYLGWNFYDNNNEIFNGSDDSHGTHGAGTIAASRNDVGIAGIAGSSAVRIMPVKALGGTEGAGTTASIIKAIRYAEQNGAVICNLSFGTSKNDLALKNAIADSDMLFIAAAGNGSGLAGSVTGQNTDRSPIYPAAYDLDNIISVANLQYDGTLHYSSNYGITSVDLAAPGSYILSTTPGGTYSYMTGTSMAAPMVTGVAALIYSHYKDITLPEIRERILASVRQLDSLKGLVATGGMLDAYAALTGDFDALEEMDESDQTDTDKVNPEKDVSHSPVISATTYNDWYNRYFILTVTDPDDDVAAVRYASGLWEAKDFDGGGYGTEVVLGEDHTAAFRIVRRGTFTFYALDSAGNETVFSVYIK